MNNKCVFMYANVLIKEFYHLENYQLFLHKWYLTQKQSLATYKIMN